MHPASDKPTAKASSNEVREAKKTSACPQCGQRRLVPISRRGIDHVIGLFVALRRYRCKNMDCRWEGNLVKWRPLRKTVNHVPNMEKPMNWLMIVSVLLMSLAILAMILFLLFAWYNGSLESYDDIIYPPQL